MRRYEILMRQHGDKNTVLSPHIRRVGALYLALSHYVACAFSSTVAITRNNKEMSISFRRVVAFR
jgi:hypothetical protein